MKALPSASADQLEAFLWAELFAICLFQPMFGALDLHYACAHKPLSLLKMAQFFPMFMASVFIKFGDPMLLSSLLETHFFLEKRNKKKPALLHPIPASCVSLEGQSLSMGGGHGAKPGPNSGRG